MRICILGTGYVGLVAGGCLSDSGNHVVCVDVDRAKLKMLQTGQAPFFEPGLEEILKLNISAKRLTFSADASSAIAASQVVFVAVGTPEGESGSADLRYVNDVVQTVRQSVTRPTFLVLKSTVPVGTADKIKEELKNAPARVEVISNPEFLKQGSAVNDFMKPERVIIGCESDAARQVMTDLYAPYVRSGNPMTFMSHRSAELAKYAANTFLAMKISYINEIALLAEKTGADIREVRQALITDQRIGNQFLYPGCGYGGSCFPKDVQALTHLGRGYGLNMELFSAVQAVNERQKRMLFQKMRQHFGSQLTGKTIALWGLSFKPMTDDMRDAPATALIQQLLEAGCRVRAYDPVAAHNARTQFGERVMLFKDAYEALQGADGMAILTEWNEFRNPDFASIKASLRQPVIFDGRNLYRNETLRPLGFVYYSIGQVDPAPGVK